MIVHFINGPRHGESCAIQGNQDRILVPVADDIACRYVADDPVSLIGPSWTEHEYRITRRARYAIAEYVEPKVKTYWYVEVKVADRYNTDALHRLDFWLLDRRQTLRPELVCWNGARRHTYDKATLDFIITVDGPPNAAAIADAGAKLQEWLDKMVPAGITVASVEAASSR